MRWHEFLGLTKPRGTPLRGEFVALTVSALVAAALLAMFAPQTLFWLAALVAAGVFAGVLLAVTVVGRLRDRRGDVEGRTPG
ncbi:hypothetical protein V6N00_03590 [Tersicoccus sp. MR15.9]|uniref:hypothetical protein n=1 Tax=Tersicoccus mangrovi TaxID=3121635 RepID=UPI002FE5FE53